MVPDEIRNVVLVGHGGSGKTSLAEALLHTAGVTNRRGRVEDGNTVTDFDPEEVARQISLGLAMAPFEWRGHRVNLIDTPGFADFIGDVRAALRVSDLALFVVSGVDGVEVQTELIWRLAEEEGVARAIFISKLDRDRSSYARVLEELRTVFGTGIAPLEVPVGSESGLRGVVGIVANEAFLYGDGNSRGTPAPVPDDLKDQIEEVRTSLVESVVETDDELLERYLEGQEPSAEELMRAMRSGIAAGSTVPVLCGSAGLDVGLDRLADFLVDFGPAPTQRPSPPLLQGEALAADPDGPTVAYVFKTAADPYVGRISLFRVFSGTVRPDQELENPARGVTGRMHNIFAMRGKETLEAEEVVAGDIAAVGKLESTLSGDTLRSPGSPVLIRPVEMPRPVMSLAVSPKTTSDEEKLSTALQRLADEDPSLVVERRSDTHQTVISGMGDTHLDVSVARLARKFGVDVSTSMPIVPYRETIGAAAEAEGKHKKQSGGRGQYGIANVRFEPLERGSGYEFVDQIVGGSIPRQYIPAVDKGIQEALERGIVAGYPVVDMRAVLFDGKYHSVDSDEFSFKMAGIMAVRAAGERLRPVLLEPIVKATIRVPEDYMGDVIGDINAKRGRVLGMDSEGHLRVVTAQVPLAEMQRYAIDLRSITGGRGSFEMEFDHYAEVPHNEAQRVIAAARKGD
ncbi:MAG: elongation factor G [Actinomycetota bacterium]|nr:elongation factor G [Actinomycetota bacterium]